MERRIINSRGVSEKKEIKKIDESTFKRTITRT